MENVTKREIEYTSSTGKPEQFIISEFPDHIVITAYLTRNLENVEVPHMINGKQVIAIDEGNCFFGHKEMYSIAIPNTILRIGVQSLAMTGLRDLMLPDSITEIGHHAFRDCRSLKKVVLPCNLKRIPVGAFSFCYWDEDTEIILPDSLKVIEENAFYSAQGGSIIIPDSVEEIGRQAFYMGPKPITKLPFDRRWYEEWPIGELVRDMNGRIGEVDSVKALESNCMTVKIRFDQSVREFFLPTDLRENRLSFIEASQQQYADKYFRESLKSEKSLYELWQKGLI